MGVLPIFASSNLGADTDFLNHGKNIFRSNQGIQFLTQKGLENRFVRPRDRIVKMKRMKTSNRTIHYEHLEIETQGVKFSKGEAPLEYNFA